MNTTQAILRPLLIVVALGCILASTLGHRPELFGPVAAPPGARALDVAVEDEDARLEVLERRVAEASARARESTLVLEYAAADAPSGARRVATGVVIDEQGDVVSVRIDPPPTDAPVVARDASGRRLPAKWVAADAESGLSLLRVDAPGVRPIRVAGVAARLGSQVLVIGNPFGLGHSVRRGQVAGLDRRLELGTRQLGGLIQVDVALHPGDSGALVANLKGEWLGLIRSGLTTPDARKVRDHDLGFAIAARDALWVADQLRTHQRVDRAFLGVQIDPTATDDPPGAVLGGILADTPAARAGLQPGDRVVAIDGHPIQSPLNLTDHLDRTLAHTEVTIEALRGSRRDHLVLRTASRPPSALPASPSAPAPSVPKPDELRLSIPREVLERLERLERRIDELEKERAERSKPSSQGASHVPGDRNGSSRQRGRPMSTTVTSPV
ncbi:MAG TPA: trypsin-like peptidase domain-containing protein [Isosphaeraceae bacterium]|nr:trypsin-like peptidase domain-containing protein [Isosphaeraceae bacterium]